VVLVDTCVWIDVFPDTTGGEHDALLVHRDLDFETSSEVRALRQQRL